MVFQDFNRIRDVNNKKNTYNLEGLNTWPYSRNGIPK